VARVINSEAHQTDVDLTVVAVQLEFLVLVLVTVAGSLLD